MSWLDNHFNNLWMLNLYETEHLLGWFVHTWALFLHVINNYTPFFEECVIYV